ncbi:MAG TPA: M20/M25/M40 family metallo-hydrolase, partial [Solirubrobacteraceae bacterium]|nr:M20/M25/M40 family metallo-hydrolase [Solirubrobacteraceae bacterium]
MATIDAVCELLTALVACDSTNPSLAAEGAGESSVARLVASRLRHAGLNVQTWEQAPGRLGVLGVLPGTGGGERLLLCHHLDVVAGNPASFVPSVRDGRMYGRGTSDMKGGLAASILAAQELAGAGPRLRGDLLVAGVIDEEWLSAGAVELAERLAREGLTVDGAVLPEATGLDVIVEHGGFAWWELVSKGVEAAGDDPGRGVDAIALAGRALTALLELDAQLAARPATEYGRPCVHASTVSGGRQLSAYPGSCTVGIERCTIPGETVEQARAELAALLDCCAADDPRARYTLRTIVGRDAISLPATEPVVHAVTAAARARLGERSRVRGDMGWMDSGVLVEAGIPCVAFGPRGDGEHTD